MSRGTPWTVKFWLQSYFFLSVSDFKQNFFPTTNKNFLGTCENCFHCVERNFSQKSSLAQKSLNIRFFPTLTKISRTFGNNNSSWISYQHSTCLEGNFRLFPKTPGIFSKLASQCHQEKFEENIFAGEIVYNVFERCWIIFGPKFLAKLAKLHFKTFREQIP